MSHAREFLSRISDEVLAKLQNFADFAMLHSRADDGWKLTLGRAASTFTEMSPNDFGPF